MKLTFPRILLALVLCAIALGQTLLNLPPAPADRLVTLGVWSLSDGLQRQAYEVQWWSRPEYFCIERVTSTATNTLVPTRAKPVTNTVGVAAVWLIDLLPVGTVADYRLRTLTAAEWNALPATNSSVCGAITVAP